MSRVGGGCTVVVVSVGNESVCSLVKRRKKQTSSPSEIYGTPSKRRRRARINKEAKARQRPRRAGNKETTEDEGKASGAAGPAGVVIQSAAAGAEELIQDRFPAHEEDNAAVVQALSLLLRVPP